MKNDQLTQIWQSQKRELPHDNLAQIIKKAKKQRNSQYYAIGVISMTILVLVLFTIFFVPKKWNDFAFGLVLMIASLLFRVILECVSLFRKESQLITLDSTSFQVYLKKHSRLRLKINYFVTPLCFAVYVFGLTKLFPYFKEEFSGSLYNYFLISGFGSLFVIAILIVNDVRKEINFLKQIDKE